jgi:hypothetical protein
LPQTLSSNPTSCQPWGKRRASNTSTGMPRRPSVEALAPRRQSSVQASAFLAFQVASLTSRPAAPRLASKTRMPLLPRVMLGTAGIQ